MIKVFWLFIFVFFWLCFDERGFCILLISGKSLLVIDISLFKEEKLSNWKFEKSLLKIILFDSDWLLNKLGVCVQFLIILIGLLLLKLLNSILFDGVFNFLIIFKFKISLSLFWFINCLILFSCLFFGIDFTWKICSFSEL